MRQTSPIISVQSLGSQTWHQGSESPRKQSSSRCRLVDAERVADDGSLAPETALPIRIADDGNWMPAGHAVVLSTQLSPGVGFDSEQGEKAPETRAIPDALAYRHFLSATTLGSNASPQDRRIQRLQLDRVGLSDADRNAYLTTIQPLRGRLSASITREPNIMSDTLEQLRGQLTPDGFQRLQEHVRTYVKPRIKIYASAQ